MIEQWTADVAGTGAVEWATVAAYLVAALLAVRAAGTARDAGQNGEKRFWLTLATLLVLLGINEPLDLQLLMTDIPRAHAKSHDWYNDRRQIQFVFVLALGAAAAVAGIAVVWLTWRMPRSVQLALVGLVFIGLFVLLRAASFHHLDDLLGRGFLIFNLGELQELIGVSIVAGAAILRTRDRSPTLRA